jgi:hypothetical protein
MLVLRLRSPGIFTDPQGRPSRDPDPSELTEVLGTPARVVRRWTRWQQAGGWHIASGLPKPSELAVASARRTSFLPNGPWLIPSWPSSASGAWACGDTRASAIWPRRPS